MIRWSPRMRDPVNESKILVAMSLSPCVVLGTAGIADRMSDEPALDVIVNTTRS